MKVLSDRIVDDGKKGFSFPIFPAIHDTTLHIIDMTREWDWETRLTPSDERDILDSYIRLNTRYHIVGWSSALVVRVLREYYKTLGIYDSIQKRVAFKKDAPPPITLGVTLDCMLYSESDFRQFPALEALMPAPRTTQDRKEIQSGINEGIITTLDLPSWMTRWEIVHGITFLIRENFISPFRLGQVLSYWYERIGIRTWEATIVDEIFILHS